ncbi:unnamed protein product [Prunus armeniaca]
MKNTRAAMVQKLTVAQMWTDIGILEKNAAWVLGLLLEQKFIAVIRMLTYGSSADHVDKIAMMRKFTTLESLGLPAQTYAQGLGWVCNNDFLLGMTCRLA